MWFGLSVFSCLPLFVRRPWEPTTDRDLEFDTQLLLLVGVGGRGMLWFMLAGCWLLASECGQFVKLVWFLTQLLWPAVADLGVGVEVKTEHLTVRTTDAHFFSCVRHFINAHALVQDELSIRVCIFSKVILSLHVSSQLARFP